jgi:hypothetical protein
MRHISKNRVLAHDAAKILSVPSLANQGLSAMHTDQTYLQGNRCHSKDLRIAIALAVSE